jgi:hypothetical protein
MIKTAINLLIAAFVLNACARAAVAAWDYYQLKDETQQLVTFGANVSTDDLHNEIVGQAEKLHVPLDPDNVRVEREGRQTFAEGHYTQPIELVPGYYTYPVELSFEADAIAVAPATAKDAIAP